MNTVTVERLLDAHRDGRRAGGDAIWALLNLELWFRTFIDGDGVQTLPEPVDPSIRFESASALAGSAVPSSPVGSSFRQTA
jgi:hypothetical protein